VWARHREAHIVVGRRRPELSDPKRFGSDDLPTYVIALKILEPIVPSATPTAAPATTSDGWWMRTYARLTATTAAVEYHTGANRLPVAAVRIAALKNAADA